jgi:hypothetical protein
VTLWVDQAGNKLLKAMAADAQKLGAVVLANSGITSGTVTLAAGVNPSSSDIITSAVHSGDNCQIFLTIKTPLAITDIINVAVGNISDGTSFKVFGNGTTSNTLTVSWFIVNAN